MRDRPWASIATVATRDGQVWFKECAPAMAFEPRLSAVLSLRSPDVVAEVLGYDEERRWLLLADAGEQVGPAGNTPRVWERLFPRYAELQIRELELADEHLAHGVPDRRTVVLPELYDAFLDEPMPIGADEVDRLRAFAPQLASLAGELATAGVPDSVQHDDMHAWNVFARGDELRLLDWGDACVSHPFTTVGVTFRFLEERHEFPAGHPVYRRLRDCYLEPWGRGLSDVFDLALRVGAFAHAVAWSHQRARLTPADRVEFDEDYVNVLGRAVRFTA